MKEWLSEGVAGGCDGVWCVVLSSFSGADVITGDTSEAVERDQKTKLQLQNYILTMHTVQVSLALLVSVSDTKNVDGSR